MKIINAEARRLQYLLNSEILSEYDKAVFLSLLDKDMDEATLCNSLFIRNMFEQALKLNMQTKEIWMLPAKKH